MKAIEIPVDQMNLQGASSVVGSTPTAQFQQPITQTIVKQGAIAAPYTRPVNAAATTIGAEKKEPQLQQTVQALEKKESVSNPSIEKAVSPVVVSEKKDEVALVQPEKKVQPKVNPWTRKVEFVPSNLVPQNLSKAVLPER